MTENVNTEVPAGSEPAAAPSNELTDARYHSEVNAPDRAPMPGTRHAWDKDRGIWVVERVPDDESRPAAPKEAEAAAQQDVTPDDYVPEIPGHVPQSVQHNETVQESLRELGGFFRESGIAPEVGQSYVDVYTEYALEHPASEVDPLNPGAVHSQLKALWGETYSTRWGHVMKVWNSMSAKTQDWVANNAEHPVAMFRTLAAIGSGGLALSREQAQAAVDKMRADRKSPLYDVAHKEHRLFKDTYRNLSLVANREDRKGRQGSVEEMVKDRTAKEPAGDSPEAKLDAELRTLRTSPAYFDKSRPEHKAVVERVREIYRTKFPD